MSDAVWVALAVLDLAALLIALCYMARRMAEEMRKERERKELRNVRALPSGERGDTPDMHRVHRRRNMYQMEGEKRA